MTDRDQFAAAALTGLIASREWPIDSDEAAHYCYRVADAMLRERERRAPKILNSGEYGPEWHAAAPNLDAAPAARARTDADSDRTDKAAPRPGEGTGDTPVTEPMPVLLSDSGFVTPVSYAKSDEKRVNWPTNRGTTPPRNGTPAEGSVQGESTEPVAWIAVFDGDDADGEFVWPDKGRAIEWASTRPGVRIAPLYRQPTLTDEEREAIEEAIKAFDEFAGDEVYVTALRGLLERLG